jgi:hypothetical protein
MTTLTKPQVQQNLVADLRQVRDQLSAEIQDMSFEEERAYLDRLLANRKNSKPEHGPRADGADY